MTTCSQSKQPYLSDEYCKECVDLGLKCFFTTAGQQSLEVRAYPSINTSVIH